MSDYGSKKCPSVARLLDFAQATDSDKSLSNHRIKTHLQSCMACRSVVERALCGGFDTAFPLEVPALSGQLRKALDAQRQLISNNLRGIKPAPQVGQVWTTAAHWAESAGGAVLALLVIVLRSFDRPVLGGSLIDVAPLSEDARLATEWSLIFSEDESGLDMPIVAHLDFQVTTSPKALDAFIGEIADSAAHSLITALETFDCGNSAQLPNSGPGRWGKGSVRVTAAWSDFEQELSTMTAGLARLLDDPGESHQKAGRSSGRWKALDSRSTAQLTLTHCRTLRDALCLVRSSRRSYDGTALAFNEDVVFLELDTYGAVSIADIRAAGGSWRTLFNASPLSAGSWEILNAIAKAASRESLNGAVLDRAARRSTWS